MLIIQRIRIRPPSPPHCTVLHGHCPQRYSSVCVSSIVPLGGYGDFLCASCWQKAPGRGAGEALPADGSGGPAEGGAPEGEQGVGAAGGRQGGRSRPRRPHPDGKKKKKKKKKLLLNTVRCFFFFSAKVRGHILLSADLTTF